MQLHFIVFGSLGVIGLDILMHAFPSATEPPWRGNPMGRPHPMESPSALVLVPRPPCLLCTYSVHTTSIISLLYFGANRQTHLGLSGHELYITRVVLHSVPYQEHAYSCTFVSKQVQYSILFYYIHTSINAVGSTSSRAQNAPLTLNLLSNLRRPQPISPPKH